MNINVIINAVVFFILIMFIHIAYWRLCKPKGHITPLALVFVVIPVILLAACYFGDNTLFHDQDLWLSVILYFAFAGVYIQTYPPIQANCPSLYIVNVIGRKGRAQFRDIKIAITGKKLTKVDPRIADLTHDGFIRISKQKKISLTAKGRLIASTYSFYRKRFLGLAEGEG